MFLYGTCAPPWWTSGLVVEKNLVKREAIDVFLEGKGPPAVSSQCFLLAAVTVLISFFMFST